MNAGRAVALDPSRILQNLDGMEEDIAAVQIGLSQNIDFILLRYYRPGQVPVRVTGVDGVRIKLRYDAQANTDVQVVELREGEDIVFMPDLRTRQRYAFLPDTEHNRSVLATGLREKRWEITDKDIEAQIIKLKEKKFAHETHDVSKMHTSISDTSFQTPAHDLAKLPDNEIDATIKQKQKELQDLMRAKQDRTDMLETGETQFAGQAPEGMSLEEAKKIVHAKYKNDIDELIAQGKKKYWMTSLYYHKIKPEIDLLVNPALGEATAPKQEEVPAPEIQEPVQPTEPDGAQEPEPEFEPPAE